MTLTEGTDEAWHVGAKLASAETLSLNLEAGHRRREGHVAVHSGVVRGAPGHLNGNDSATLQGMETPRRQEPDSTSPVPPGAARRVAPLAFVATRCARAGSVAARRTAAHVTGPPRASAPWVRRPRCLHLRSDRRHGTQRLAAAAGDRRHSAATSGNGCRAGPDDAV